MLERRSPSNFSRPTARHRRRYGSPILSSAAAASFLLAIVLRASYERSVAAQPVGDDDGGGGGGASYPGCDGDIALIGDSLCDFDLNIDACGFDGGDCCECTCIDTEGQACGEGGAGFFCLDPDAPQNCGPTGSPTPSPSSLEASSAPSSETSGTYPGCGGYLPHMGDGFCDEALNNAACDFDGGDCCACTCGGGTSIETDDLEHSCGYAGDGFDCRDPDVPDDCGATPSPAGSYPDCTGYMYDWQDSYCDYDLNTEECGWDGGDCCPCTCREYYSWSNTCGYFGYDCMDPEAPTTCSTESPTPSPATDTDFPECEGTIYSIGDGYCNSYNNNEECDWDGGDCCPCTCEDTGSWYYSSCGYYGYDCLDPAVSTDCSPAPTPSPTLSPYPECLGIVSYIGDGDCDSSNNNEECGWDGGDCCPCTCDDTDSWYTCGDGSYDCLDPTVSTDCVTTNYDTSNTYCPYGGDGKCDLDYNTAACDWDGGDCCECDCVSIYYTCGYYTFECLDPDSSCSSATPSPASTSSDSPVSTSSYSSGQIVGGFSLAMVAFCCFGGILFAACSSVRGKCRRAQDDQDAGGGVVPGATGAPPPEPESTSDRAGEAPPPTSTSIAR